ncbi:helix-turn-helix domain-containing protein [Streptomyces sp. NPDC046805]|uniref:helix-turn-helix domain-containing protein n=1 Tax=Streptomyces sp. NPDC046805 TaxID=3155134 RepID=UPI00340E2F1B
MSRWKQLPASLDPRVRQLVVQLRRVKDHSGLSTQALAARTGYSRSSWDRYLNGRAVPPQQAVAELARTCGIDPARLLALHEVAVEPGNVAADHAVDADNATDADDEPEGGRGHSPGRRTRLTVLAAAGVAVLALTATVLVWAAPWDGGGGGARAGRRAAPSATSDEASQTVPGRGEFVYRAGKDYPCKVHRDKNGLLYAGYSTTRTALIGMQSAQWNVVEAQCLLRHHGFSPGIIDGMYGTHTERAVERLQDRAHIAVDGVVGEDTWGVLRK